MKPNHIQQSAAPSGRLRGLVLTIVLGLAAFAVLAPDYSIPWYTIDGGGGTSTGGVYSVSGTIGQPDAGAMNGGNYSLVGGFWSVAAVQTPGAPFLTVSVSNRMVLVSWPLPAEGWLLHATTNLVTGGSVWTEIAPPYATNATQVYFTEPLPSGKKFYRLHKP
jgi:hypothetical protein